MYKKPIGIFDSGIGGTSIVREIQKLLPKEFLVYIKDSNNFPYGNKTPEQIRKIAKRNVELLLEQGAKIIVVACNTATVHAISFLRKKFPVIDFVGVEPAVKPAGRISKKGILVLSSPKAAASAQLMELIGEYARGKNVINVGSLELVEAIEKRRDPTMALQKALSKEVLKEIDVIVLGCTHFPLIKNEIQEFVGPEIKLVDSGEAVARRTKYLLDHVQYYFYLLRCSDNSLYSGITNDLENRIKAHNFGKGAKYTKSRRPVKLVYFEKLENKSMALKREAEVKKWSKTKKEKLFR